MQDLTRALALAAILALSGGCSGDEAASGEAEDGAHANAPEVVRADDDESAEASGDDDGDEIVDSKTVGKPSDDPVPARRADGSPGEAGQGAAVSQAAAEKFKAWGVVHAFMGSRVDAGQVISANEAIAFTKDNHVGVTTDGGASWNFIRHATGDVSAVGGAPGGPYVAGGKRGYMAISFDGKLWSDLPRHHDFDIVAVEVNNSTIVGLAKKGRSVRYDKNGNNGYFKLLPDQFDARGMFLRGNDFIAYKGRNKAYKSTDGLNWAPLPDFEPPDTRKVPTSKGLCQLGRVGKGRGVVCEVKGLAHGLAAGVAVVDQKKSVAMTRDGGNTWVTAELPFKLESVIGGAGGPWYALGSGGGLASTRDGAFWQRKNLNASKTLRAGLIDGATIIVVGDGGTIARSEDGGESWQVLEPPTGGSFKQIVKIAGKFVIPAGRGAIESSDGGKTWTEVTDPGLIEQIPAAERPGTCEGRLPKPGEVCKYERPVTTPMGLPNVRAFTFNGDIGLAMGDTGLVAMSNDGGATWRHKSGFDLSKLQDFNTRGNVIVAIGKKNIVFSVDGGKSYAEAQLPSKIGKITTSLITEDGMVLAAGSKATILRATGNLTNWLQLSTFANNRASYEGLYSVQGVLYATGRKGELHRSQNKGLKWFPLTTGVPGPILAMTGEGSTVLAVAKGKRTGNLLLRSNDGGLHFFVQREISHNYGVDEFSLSGGVLVYNDRKSKDFGATWVPWRKDYIYGAVDVGDGSGVRLVNRSRYKTKWQFSVVGPDADDWTIIDSFVNYGARFTCDKGTGCWMISDGQVYRPL